jgi:hypothetical protein
MQILRFAQNDRLSRERSEEFRFCFLLLMSSGPTRASNVLPCRARFLAALGMTPLLDVLEAR